MTTETFEFPQILRLWNSVTSTAASGCLTVWHREKEVRLYFKHGVLRYAQMCGVGRAYGHRALEELTHWHQGELNWRDDLQAQTQNVTVEHAAQFRRSLQKSARLGLVESTQGAPVTA